MQTFAPRWLSASAFSSNVFISIVVRTTPSTSRFCPLPTNISFSMADICFSISISTSEIEDSWKFVLITIIQIKGTFIPQAFRQTPAPRIIIRNRCFDVSPLLASIINASGDELRHATEILTPNSLSSVLWLEVEESQLCFPPWQLLLPFAAGVLSNFAFMSSGWRLTKSWEFWNQLISKMV